MCFRPERADIYRLILVFFKLSIILGARLVVWPWNIGIVLFKILIVGIFTKIDKGLCQKRESALSLVLLFFT